MAETSGPLLDPRRVEDLYRLSPMQQGMLFELLARPEDRLYFEQSLCTLSGRLDRRAFAAAWQRSVARHPALRTAFLWQGLSRPVQAVHKRARLTIRWLDLRGLSPEARERELARLLRRDRRHGFALDRPPLSRLCLLRTGERRHELLWSSSHLIVDAWCLAILLEEALSLYRARTAGEEPPPLAPAGSFKEYIGWLARRPTGEAESYWRRRLAGFVEPTPLALNAGAGPAGSAGTAAAGVADNGGLAAPDGVPEVEDGYGRFQLRLDATASGALAALVRQHRITFHTLALAAWALVLARRSGRSEVLFGTVVSGRPPELPGVETIVGMFINTVPVRVAVPPDRELLPWLTSLQREEGERRRHEHAPLGQIVQWSEVERGGRLFDTILVFLNVHSFGDGLSRSFSRAADGMPDDGAAEDNALRITDARDIARSNFPLAVRLKPGERVTLEAIVDGTSCRPEAAAELLAAWRELLNAIATDPLRTLGELTAALDAHRQEQRRDRSQRRQDRARDRLRGLRPAGRQLEPVGGGG